jgi:hypothetical protein
MNLPSILAGAAVALVLWVLAVGGRGSEGRRAASVVLAALIPLSAVATTHYIQGAGFAMPPKEFMHAALLSGVGAAVFAIIAGFHRRWGQWVAVLGFSSIAVALFLLATKSLHERYWDGQVALYVACLAGITVIAYGGRLAAEARDRTIEAALATGLATLAAAIALGQSTGVSAQDAVALSSSAGLFGLLAAALTKWRPDDTRPLAPIGRAAATTQTALFAGLLGNGVLYAETPQRAGVLLIAAPLLALLPGRSVLASILRLSLVAGVAAYAAFISQVHVEPNPYGY